MIVPPNLEHLAWLLSGVSDDALPDVLKRGVEWSEAVVRDYRLNSGNKMTFIEAAWAGVYGFVAGYAQGAAR